MNKIIFIDIDGTLVDYENNLPESAIYAIRKARENGHRVYISTGRSKAEIYQELWNIGLDGMIGGNGSYVEDICLVSLKIEFVVALKSSPFIERKWSTIL